LLVANRWNAAVVTGPAASGCKYWTHCAWRSADNRTPTTAETLVQKFDRWNKRRQLGGRDAPTSRWHGYGPEVNIAHLPCYSVCAVNNGSALLK